ncbi:MAG: ABC transporter permease [Acidimicrobiia bacterium]|nr:ABC transporter permease [Acidimicrobiia bacterium]
MTTSIDTTSTAEDAHPAATIESAQLSGLGPAAPAERDRRWINVVGPLVVLGAVIGVWYLLHYWALESLFDKPGFLVTEPHRVVKESFLDGPTRSAMFRALGWTAVVSMVGLGVSIVLGMTLAVLMAQATWVERSFWPYLIAAQAVPILAIVPILGNIFGFGMGTRVVVCVIISIFPIVSNTLFGLLSAEPSQHDLFTLKRAGRLTRLRKLQLPAAMPAIFTGFRIAAGLSVIGAVVGELFFRRGGKGIGILMDQYRSRTLYPQTYGALILSSLLGIAVFVFFGWVSKLVIGRWHESTRKSG